MLRCTVEHGYVVRCAVQQGNVEMFCYVEMGCEARLCRDALCSEAMLRCSVQQGCVEISQAILRRFCEAWLCCRCAAESC